MTLTDEGLLDLLSEMIAVERDAERLYEQLLADAPAALHPKLVEYAEQRRRDGLVLEEAVRRLGGDPEHVSAGARAVHDMTQAVLDASARVDERRWMYELLHVITFETRDRIIWELLDELAATREGPAREVLHTAATAVISREALGAHDVDRNEERIWWVLDAMRLGLADELGLDPGTARQRRRRRR
ncbi:MAG TPA: hypothetical protein VL422_06725 [Miltoncostaea sp.]|jgi:hypothetical protein|nr:hypothetical protein [Miltoncostaea sp.]